VTGLDNLPVELGGRAQPMINQQSPSHLLGPGDLATIYNVDPLLQTGFNGSGQKIVVAGKSALKLSDIQVYRSLVGLPRNDPKIILRPGFDDPGTNEEFQEVTSDVEIAGGAAPNASIISYAPERISGCLLCNRPKSGPGDQFQLRRLRKGCSVSTSGTRVGSCGGATGERRRNHLDRVFRRYRSRGLREPKNRLLRVERYLSGCACVTSG
jgi:hypothetical protein